MNETATHFPVLFSNRPGFALVCGGILVGVLLGTFLKRRFGYRWLPTVGLLVGMGVGYAIGISIENSDHRRRVVAAAMALATGAEPSASMAAADPGYLPELRRRLEERLPDVPIVRASDLSQHVMAELFDERMQVVMATASTPALRRMVEADLALLQGLRGDPELCLARFKGRRVSAVGRVDPAVVAESEAARLAVIRSSKSTATAAPASEIQVGSALLQAVERAGVDPASLARFERVDQLPPAEGCARVITFAKLLVDMDEETMAMVLRFLTASARQ